MTGTRLCLDLRRYLVTLLQSFSPTYRWVFFHSNINTVRAQVSISPNNHTLRFIIQLTTTALTPLVYHSPFVPHDRFESNRCEGSESTVLLLRVLQSRGYRHRMNPNIRCLIW